MSVSSKISEEQVRGIQKELVSFLSSVKGFKSAFLKHGLHAELPYTVQTNPIPEEKLDLVVETLRKLGYVEDNGVWHLEKAPKTYLLKDIFFNYKGWKSYYAGASDSYPDDSSIWCDENGNITIGSGAVLLTSKGKLSANFYASGIDWYKLGLDADSYGYLQVDLNPVVLYDNYSLMVTEEEYDDGDLSISIFPISEFVYKTGLPKVFEKDAYWREGQSFGTSLDLNTLYDIICGRFSKKGSYYKFPKLLHGYMQGSSFVYDIYSDTEKIGTVLYDFCKELEDVSSFYLNYFSADDLPISDAYIVFNETYEKGYSVERYDVVHNNGVDKNKDEYSILLY